MSEQPTTHTNEDWISITKSPISHDELVASVKSNRAGAVVLFLGTVRELTDGKATNSLEYQAFDEMAVRKIGQIIDEAKSKWSLQKAAVVHRVGHLELGEAAVGVAVSSPHRAECFDASCYIMDRIKQDVPIWKKENWADGSAEWVHPGVEEAARQTTPADATNSNTEDTRCE